MLLGWAVITVNDTLVKSLSGAYPPGQIIFLRGLFVAIPLAWLVHRAGGPRSLRAVHPRAQALRGVLLAVSTFLFVTSLRYLPLADAVALTFATPLVLTAIAPWLLGEHIGWRRGAAVALGFTGVLVVLRPGADAFSWYALMPLGAAVLEAFRDVVTRRVVALETPPAMLAWSTGVVTLAGLGTAVLGWSAPAGADLVLMALAGCAMGAGIFLTAEAFRHAEAVVISPFRYSAILWAVLLGAAAFGDWPDGWTVAGTALIVASGLYILHRETVRAA